jgi:hypothetical protein
MEMIRKPRPDANAILRAVFEIVQRREWAFGMALIFGCPLATPPKTQRGLVSLFLTIRAKALATSLTVFQEHYLQELASVPAASRVGLELLVAETFKTAGLNRYPIPPRRSVARI